MLLLALCLNFDDHSAAFMVLLLLHFYTLDAFRCQLDWEPEQCMHSQEPRYWNKIGPNLATAFHCVNLGK